MKTRALLVFALGASLMAVLVGCAKSGQLTDSVTAPSATSVAAAQSHAVTSFRTVNSVDELTNSADIVFIGTFTGSTNKIRVQGRDPNDPSILNPDYFDNGTLREFQVERYLKGDGAVIVNVLQYYDSHEYRVDGVWHTAISDIADYPPPVEGDRYILFLNKDDMFPDVRYAFKEPSRFHLVNGIATVDSPWHSAGIPFPDTTEQELVSAVQTTAGSPAE